MLSSTDDKARPVAAARYPASVEDQSLQNGSNGALFSGARPRKGASSAAEVVWSWEKFGWGVSRRLSVIRH